MTKAPPDSTCNPSLRSRDDTTFNRARCDFTTQGPDQETRAVCSVEGSAGLYGFLSKGFMSPLQAFLPFSLKLSPKPLSQSKEYRGSRIDGTRFSTILDGKRPISDCTWLKRGNRGRAPCMYAGSGGSAQKRLGKASRIGSETRATTASRHPIGSIWPRGRLWGGAAGVLRCSL